MLHLGEMQSSVATRITKHIYASRRDATFYVLVASLQDSKGRTGPSPTNDTSLRDAKRDMRYRLATNSCIPCGMQHNCDLRLRMFGRNKLRPYECG